MGGSGRPVTALLDVLEAEYRALLTYQGPDDGRPFFSHPLFTRIVLQYRDWERGIPPGREWRGRGSQNPHLLAAFRRLAVVEADVRNEQRAGQDRAAGVVSAEDRAAFERRIVEAFGSPA